MAVFKAEADKTIIVTIFQKSPLAVIANGESQVFFEVGREWAFLQLQTGQGLGIGQGDMEEWQYISPDFLMTQCGLAPGSTSVPRAINGFLD